MGRDRQIPRARRGPGATRAPVRRASYVRVGAPGDKNCAKYSVRRASISVGFSGGKAQNYLIPGQAQGTGGKRMEVGSRAPEGKDADGPAREEAPEGKAAGASEGGDDGGKGGGGEGCGGDGGREHGNTKARHAGGTQVPAKRRRTSGSDDAGAAASLPPPWDADEIVPGLWLGSLEAAEDAAALAARGVALVVSLHTEEQATPAPGIRWLRIKEDDAADTDLLRHWRGLSADIHEVLVGGGTGGGTGGGRGAVLVNCIAGQSRSTATVLAYLVCRRGMTLRQAFGIAESKRPGVQPNRGFWRQLVAYEHGVRGEASYTPDELMGAIMFETEVLTGIVRRFSDAQTTAFEVCPARVCGL